MKTKENSKLFEVLKQLPESSIVTLNLWYDPDLPILNDYLDFLSETVCYLAIEMENDHFDDPKIKRRAIMLSHLYDDLKKFQNQ